MKTLRYLAFSTVALAYALIVLGAFVRITGSGMGCGDDWPLCNGRIIPPLDDPATLIEYGHRLVAAALSVMVIAVGALAYVARNKPGASGPGGTLRPALLAVGLLIVQVMLGAVTVWLELPPTAVMLHLGAALALLAAVMITGLRTGTTQHREPRSARVTGRWPILGAAALGGAVILMGGATANLGAGPACLGFPLCSGALWPPATESGLSHIHWTHRLLAYGLWVHLLALALHLRATRAPVRLRTVTWANIGIASLQLGVAAVMVIDLLPPIWRGLHAAVGTALWVALVYLAWLVHRLGKVTPPAGERVEAAAVQAA
jgi:heme A synthase